MTCIDNACASFIYGVRQIDGCQCQLIFRPDVLRFASAADCRCKASSAQSPDTHVSPMPMQGLLSRCISHICPIGKQHAGSSQAECIRRMRSCSLGCWVRSNIVIEVAVPAAVHPSSCSHRRRPGGQERALWCLTFKKLRLCPSPAPVLSPCRQRLPRLLPWPPPPWPLLPGACRPGISEAHAGFLQTDALCLF